MFPLASQGVCTPRSCLRVFVILFSSYLSTRPFCHVLSVSIFYSKIVLFPLYPVHSPPTNFLSRFFFVVLFVLLDLLGRLNGVVSLVTVFEALTIPFWSRNKMNCGIGLFHEQNIELCRRGCSFFSASTWSSPPWYSRPEKSMWFSPFCCMDFSVRSFDACDPCIAEGRNWVPTRIVYCQMSYCINWLVLFPNCVSLLSLR